MIVRSMVTLQKRNKKGQYWVCMKDGGQRLGVIIMTGPHGPSWRELGFDTKPNQCKTKEEGVARLLLRLNGGKRV